MKKLLATICAFLICSLPLFAAAPKQGQIPVYPPSLGSPAFADQQMFPSPSAFPARRYGGYHAINNSTSFQTEGSYTGGGFATFGTLTSITNLTKPYLELTTGATSGAEARVVCYSTGAAQLNFFGANPAAMAWVKTGPNTTDIQNVRIWADALGSTGNSDALPANSIAFRFSTVAGDTNWMCVTSNASATNSAVSSGVAVTSNTEYLLSWYYLSGTVYFFINGNPVLTTTTTDVPSTSAGVSGYPEGLDIWTQTAAACNGYISAQYVAQD